jgi:DNA-binding IscR family transcriptional regulator
MEENTTEHKDIALGALLDIEGAFDRTLFDTIRQAAERHGIEPAICRWICAMLESRNITATLSGETLGAPVAKGCLQEVCFHLCSGNWSWRSSLAAQ